MYKRALNGRRLLSTYIETSSKRIMIIVRYRRFERNALTKMTIARTSDSFSFKEITFCRIRVEEKHELKLLRRPKPRRDRISTDTT